MNSQLSLLTKVLRDETRQKIIMLLKENGSLSYSSLMDQAEILSTGLFNYHLKVLGDLLIKNEAGEYTLTERGVLAYKILTDFSATQSQAIDKRVYRSWIVFTIASVVIAVLNGYFFNLSLDKTLLVVFILLLTTGFAFYIRIKPSKSGNRAFFIGIGAVTLGFVFWFILILIVLYGGIRWQILNSTGHFGDFFFAITTLIICWILGGFVGDLVGRSRNYVIPMLPV